VRLRTCIGVELLVGATLLGGASVGVIYGARAAGGYLAATERAAFAEPAPPPSRARPEIEPAPAAHLAVATPAPRTGTVFAEADQAMLAPLRGGTLVGVKLNHGGTSLSLRLDFDDGTRAAFKPEQTFEQSNPRREIAAYRMDRLLGIGHVAPAFAREFPVADVLAAVDPSQMPWGAAKIQQAIIAHDGKVAGEVSWWIPEIIDAQIQGLRVDNTDGVVTWHRYLRVGDAIPDDAYEMARQLSDLILFDFLIDNVDRWSMSNTKGSPDGHILYFMDNTLSFSSYGNGRTKSHLYLHRVEKFSRRLVGRLRRLRKREVVRALADDGPLGPLVTDQEIRAVMSRRDAALAYIDGLIAEHGADQVLVFP
jgi:hypothetical protein